MEMGVHAELSYLFLFVVWILHLYFLGIFIQIFYLDIAFQFLFLFLFFVLCTFSSFVCCPHALLLIFISILLHVSPET